MLKYHAERTLLFGKLSDRGTYYQQVHGIKKRTTGEDIHFGSGLSRATCARANRDLEDLGLLKRVRHGSLRRGCEPTEYSIDWLRVRKFFAKKLAERKATQLTKSKLRQEPTVPNTAGRLIKKGAPETPSLKLRLPPSQNETHTNIYSSKEQPASLDDDQAGNTSTRKPWDRAAQMAEHNRGLAIREAFREYRESPAGRKALERRRYEEAFAPYDEMRRIDLTTGKYVNPELQEAKDCGCSISFLSEPHEGRRLTAAIINDQGFEWLGNGEWAPAPFLDRDEERMEKEWWARAAARVEAEGQSSATDGGESYEGYDGVMNLNLPLTYEEAHQD
jgi:hypothetical protein